MDYLGSNKQSFGPDAYKFDVYDKNSQIKIFDSIQEIDNEYNLFIQSQNIADESESKSYEKYEFWF